MLHFLNRRYEYVTKNKGIARLVFMHNFISVRPGLNIFLKVVTIAQHACARVLKRFQSRQHIDCKYFLRNKNTCDHRNYVKTKAYAESLKNLLANMCLRSLRLMRRPGFMFESCSENVEQRRFQRF